MICANHPDRERTAFCQNCGKPLCSECNRIVGNAVFCEPCLAARLAAADASGSSTGTPYGSVPGPGYAATAVPVPPLNEVPNPALAGLLGLIPGVGAMYNGQYAKGVVHLVIFAVLVSLSDTNSIFGLFVTGWIFYQAIEAHHTARARRDGTPLPNPFGLNDIGERLGFGKSWPNPAIPSPASAAPDSETTYQTSETAPSSQDASKNVSYADARADTQTYAGSATLPPQWEATPAGSYAYAPSSASPYGAPFPVADSFTSANRKRFPIGALVLIAFGILFFFESSGWFHHLPIRNIIPFVLIATGVWIFVRKMMGSEAAIANDGGMTYRLRLFRASRGAVWIVLIGVLFFLDIFSILFWSHSWPLFIIVAGLMKLFERSAYNSVQPAPYPPAAPFIPMQESGAATVPNAPHDVEGE